MIKIKIDDDFKVFSTFFFLKKNEEDIEPTKDN